MRVTHEGAGQRNHLLRWIEEMEKWCSGKITQLENLVASKVEDIMGDICLSKLQWDLTDRFVE